MRSAPLVRVEVSLEEAELASDALWALMPSAVQEEPLADGRMALVADPGVDPGTLLADRWVLERFEVDADAAADAWRAHARAVRAGPVVLRPSWIAHRAAPGEVVVDLEPGRSFGSGSHPSTQLAVARLAALDLRDARVLDVGCGSGVLAVTALVLGASSATGLDHDPEALAATRATAVANRVADRLRIEDRAPDQLEESFDVVVANIGAGVLTELAPSLVGLTTPGATVVLGGLLAQQADAVVARFDPFVEVARDELEGWVGPVLRRGATG